MDAAGQAIHGLQYEPRFLSSLRVILPRPAPHSPIRAISAKQFAQMHLAHSLADVDDSVLFPFLHGIEGDNNAQNMFFSSCKRKGDGPVPRYRGLTWVVCEEGTDTSSAMSISDRTSDRGLSASDGVQMTNADVDIQVDDADYDDEDDDDELWSDEDDDLGQGLRQPSDAAVPINIVHDRRPSSASSASSSGSPLSASTTSTSIFFPTPSLSSLCPRPNLPIQNANLLTSTLRPSDILVSTPHGPEFLAPRVPPGISLRNFGIQAPIYATISDIVVYSPKGLSRAAFALAERFKHAIEAKAFERANKALEQSNTPPALIPYNVFIVTDTFDVFERDHPHLVAVNSRGDTVNTINFAAREKEEMRELTKATEVGDGIWLGNLNDVPYSPKQPTSPGKLMDPFDSTNNPDGYDICIECHDCAAFPTMAQLRYMEDHFKGLDLLWEQRAMQSRAKVAADNDGDFEMIDPSRSTFAPPPPPNAGVIIHLQFPSSPPSTQHTMTHMMPLLHFLASLNASAPTPLPGKSMSQTWSPMMASASASATPSPTPGSIPRRQRKVLLYSADGYTETSVLALCLLMAQKGISLPEAYLEMQGVRSPNGPGGYHSGNYQRARGISQLLDADRERERRERTRTSGSARGRSFFVYENDLGLLRRVESKLRGATVERERERGLAGREQPNGGAKDGPVPSAPSGGGRWRWGLGGWTAARGSMSAAVAPTIVSPAPAPTLAVDTTVSSSAGIIAGSGEVSLAESPLTSISEPNVRFPSPPPEDAATPPPTSPAPSSVRSRSPTPAPSPPPQPAISSSLPHSQTLPIPHSSPSPPPHRRARASTSPLLPPLVDHQTWFNDPRFDGTFPSRVLPFLYLGNLNHASNAYMLHALGITHVVSVGECALVPPADMQNMNAAANGQGGNHARSASMTNGRGAVTGFSSGAAAGVVGASGKGKAVGLSNGSCHASSLWIEEREGRIKVLDIKGICDDGIDSLRPQFVPICDWIEKARQEGGKVLIHCRVGVSRSATITIAYLMKYAELSLVDAYLIVRSRRLSVLIQPNLIFLANLCSWEIQLARERSKDNTDELAKTFVNRALNWPYLAKEVHALNEKYLVQ